ncbi:MAG: DUF1631 family protein [Undibacterium sp.]|nr:DUF1631 family protein [Undibacterium sp.]
MSSTPTDNLRRPQPPQPAVRGDIWQALVQQVTHLSVAQLDAFSARLSNALFAASEQMSDSKEANLTFNAARLLKNNAYAFYFLTSSAIEASFRKEIQALRSKAVPETVDQDVAMTLVSYEEMDRKLALGRVSRALELTNAEELAALNMRLGCVLESESLNIAQNPFRPEVFLNTLQAAWCEFSPDVASHHLILPLLRADILFELSPILRALNETLVARGILPELQESYRIKRNSDTSEAEKKPELSSGEVAEKLKRYFSERDSQSQQYGQAENAQRSNSGSFQQVSAGGMSHGSSGGSPVPGGGQYDGQANAPYNAVDTKLFHYLADLQKSMAMRQLASGAHEAMRLSQMREQMPELQTGGVEKNTVELLSKVFDTVFHNQDIPPKIKELIGLLQVPVLKAALMDKEFFFQEKHPARRLIDLLSKYSASWDQQKGTDDPLFQTMQRNVSRVQQEFDQKMDLFDEVVSELETFMEKEEAARAAEIQEPINRALQREKFKQANIAATNEVALRVGTGEVVAFVETFLENRWIKVLTLAYSVKEDKPHAIVDAIKTMDELIWSVKPKITLAQRQEMVNRLPAVLARLNKWLSLIKWEDADRMRFFADLAECHASIVRAPLDLTPERQLEMAVEVAQKAAERRLEKRALAEEGIETEKEPDNFVDIVANLERGVWLQFTKKDGSTHNVRLAWVSPMRSLYIFTSSQKEKSFSVSTEELEQNFRDQKAQILVLDKVVDRALMAALDDSEKQDTAETVS